MKLKKISNKFNFVAINGNKVFKGQNALKHINKVDNFLHCNAPKFKKGRLYHLSTHEGFVFVNAIKSKQQMSKDFMLWNNSNIQNEEIEDIFDFELEGLEC